MTAIEVAIRAVHFVATVLEFGGFVFIAVVGRPAVRQAAEASSFYRDLLRDRSLRIAAWSLLAIAVSGSAWLVIQTVQMSGLPVDQALRWSVLSTVIGKTQFGQVSEVRAALATALGLVLLVYRRAANDRRWITLATIGTVLAGGLLASLAWTGHATADQGVDRIVHLVADSVHLMAAGAWLGSLPLLVFLLVYVRRRSDPHGLTVAQQSIRRFSALGLVSVGLLVASGLGNSWYLVGSVPALVGTDYGHLLLIKLALFAIMLVLAWINRARLTPKILASSSAKGPRIAVGQLARNATWETILGVAVVSIVSGLGIIAPAVHSEPQWPLPFTLAWQGETRSLWITWLLLAAAATGVIGISMIGVGAATQRWRTITLGSALFCGGLVGAMAPMIVPAYPTTYYRSPLRYTTQSIADGRAVYDKNCVACHGPSGNGESLAVGLPAVVTVELANKRLFEQGDGNLFWRISAGTAGTTMPGFADRLTEDERWALINFLRIQTAAAQRATTNEGADSRTDLAPDFSFQIASGPQEMLSDQQGQAVLLVLYTVPNSLTRLHELSQASDAWRQSAARIIAIPTRERVADLAGDDASIAPSILALPNASAVAAYDLLGGVGSAETEHMEILIDRRGHVRATWSPTEPQAQQEPPDWLSQIASMSGERSAVSESQDHVH